MGDWIGDSSWGRNPAFAGMTEVVDLGRRARVDTAGSAWIESPTHLRTTGICHGGTGRDVKALGLSDEDEALVMGGAAKEIFELDS